MNPPKTSEEKNIDKRKRHAEAQKRYKEKNLAKLRESNKNIQNKKRTNMKNFAVPPPSLIKCHILMQI